MRYLAAISALLAVAAARRKWTGEVKSPAHDPFLKTAEWYAEHGLPRPELAPAITTIEANKSYAVKLECAGCAYRVRPMDIFLNFTVDSTTQTLLLNYEPIAPLAPLPLTVVPIPIPADISKVQMGTALKLAGKADKSMVIPHWAVKDHLEMQFEHALVGTREPGKYWIQWDITAVHSHAGDNRRKFMLASEDQKMVQVLLREQLGTGVMSIEDIQVVLRKDRVMPFKMDCGKYAIRQTKYNPTEWDVYGKFGTATRVWHMVWWRVRALFNVQALAAIFVVLSVATAIRAVVVLRRRNAAEKVWVEDEDVEAALLANEGEDEPPAYEDVPELDEKEKKSENEGEGEGEEEEKA